MIELSRDDARQIAIDRLREHMDRARKRFTATDRTYQEAKWRRRSNSECTSASLEAVQAIQAMTQLESRVWKVIQDALHDADVDPEALDIEEATL